ncbi:coiled-coil domain-containing protein 151-like [Trematomus bernacchii]|uniref:coiled-coil domain-containing protein 151-like n=1 Tax=Trematomus bernacchii TaxID=40690 RepID=UPI00146B53C6|nr:coiled-coil domain-containing protein 151-like [Trematomus bernacchii]
MPFSADSMKPPLHDQITEMQRKIQLLEGDRTAYYESSQSTIKKNRETIRQLRQDNKRLCRKMADVNAGDATIIKVAFQNRGLEKDAYRNMSGKAALTTLDQRVLSKTKRLNALKHTTQTLQCRLDELKKEYQRSKPEGSSGAVSADTRARKKEEDAMVDTSQAHAEMFEKENLLCAEKTDRRAQRTAMQPDELSSEAQRSSPRIAGEEDKVISTFEEAFRRIKEATGVTDIQEIVERFISQKETHQHLEKLKGENETVLQQLKEQKELLDQQFQDMKYSGEAELSSDRQMLEECELQLQAQQQRCDADKERLEWLVKALSTVQAGVEHLADKLQHITLREDTVAEVSPDSDEFVLELMTQCELKLKLLHEELRGKDVSAIMKEMEEEEFYVRIEGKLPEYNTRVKLPEDQSLDLFNDEDDSEEDEADVMSREALKRHSQMIIESKSKKKPWKKKKGKF